MIIKNASLLGYSLNLTKNKDFDVMPYRLDACAYPKPSKTPSSRAIDMPPGAKNIP